jgi:hypothetical protein
LVADGGGDVIGHAWLGGRGHALCVRAPVGIAGLSAGREVTWLSVRRAERGEVMACAGVGKTTISRRWGNVRAVVVDAGS